MGTLESIGRDVGSITGRFYYGAKEGFEKSKVYYCKHCRSKLVFVEQYKRWYCNKCQKYQ